MSVHLYFWELQPVWPVVPPKKKGKGGFRRILSDRDPNAPAVVPPNPQAWFDDYLADEASASQASRAVVLPASATEQEIEELILALVLLDVL